jgi:hypothetical protein
MLAPRWPLWTLLAACDGDKPATVQTDPADADTDADTDTDTDTDTDAEVSGRWLGSCTPSFTGTTTDSPAITSLDFDLALTEASGAVEGGGALTLYFYGMDPEASPVDALGTWDGTELALELVAEREPPLQGQLSATLAGEALDGRLTLPPPSPGAPSIDLACQGSRQP